MNQEKQRHGCFTAWLIFAIITNTITATTFLFNNATVAQNYPSAPGWVWLLFAMSAMLNIVWAVALFWWKKWGFLGFVGTGIVAFILNVIVGVSIAWSFFLLLFSVLLLYGVLQIGKEKNGWTQLE